MGTIRWIEQEIKDFPHGEWRHSRFIDVLATNEGERTLTSRIYTQLANRSPFGGGNVAEVVVTNNAGQSWRYTDGTAKYDTQVREAEEAAALRAALVRADEIRRNREHERVDAIVAKGADFLDIDFGNRDWRSKVRENVGLQDEDGTDTGFDIRDGFRCVLGLTAVLQHVNGYWGYLDRLQAMGVFHRDEQGLWAAEHGFVEGEKVWSDDSAEYELPDNTATYNELQAAWERLLLGS